ncbi:hypothetical protein Tco_1312648 [Tanacetum coccineum]
MDTVHSPCKSSGCSSRIMESSQKINEELHAEGYQNVVKNREGGSILELLEEMITETKAENINNMDVKFLWGNSNFEFIYSEALGNSGEKSNLLGVGVPSSQVLEAANSLGCSVMKMPFKYLGINVGGNNSLIKAWDESINKLKTRLSKWKLKTLSIGGRLTLLKSVLGSTPIYNMSLYKVPKAVLSLMEAIRMDFFNGSKDY